MSDAAGAQDGRDAAVSLAHISDLHLPNVLGFHPRYWNVKRGLGWINWQTKRQVIHRAETVDRILADIRAVLPDHLAVTGDLVNIGLPAEYDAASAWLRSSGAPERVSVVPGNHDIYVDPQGADGTATWRDYMSSDAEGIVLGGAAGSADGDRRPWYLDAFPFVRQIGCVALIGVNSSRPTAIGHAGGTVGAEQLARLEAVLVAARAARLARVVLIHHPPVRGLASPRRALSDVGAVEDAIARSGAELVLHGHNHVVSEDEIDGAPVLGIASASAAYPYHDEPRACWRLIRIARSGGGFRIDATLRGLPHYGEDVRELGTRTFEPR